MRSLGVSCLLLGIHLSFRIYPIDAANLTQLPLGNAVTGVKSNGDCLPVKPPYHFRITTIVEQPFLFVNKTKENGEIVEFTGYIIDLLEELKTRLNFTYDLSLVPDGKYGNFKEEVNGTLTSDGMVRQIFHCEADLAVASIGITANRQKHIAFTKPWMDFGLSLLGKKPQPQNSRILAFLDPFATVTWMVTIACLVAVVLTLVVLQAITPSQFQSEETYEEKDETTIRKLYKAFWLLYTTAMQQGPEHVAYLPAKILVGSWYLFVLIIVATYTANLAAFLTVQRVPESISSVDVLAAQTVVPYGTVRSSSVEEFFFQSPIDTYSRMSRYMGNVAGVMVDSGMQGVERVKNDSNEEYVFIWDGPILEHFSSKQPCNTRVIGRSFRMQGYGIAMPMGMPYVDAFSLEVLKLRDSGWISEVARKWFDTAECGNQAAVDDMNTGQIMADQMIGVFLIIAIGITVALIVAILQRFLLRYGCLKLAKLWGKTLDKAMTIQNGYSTTKQGIAQVDNLDPVSVV